MSEPNQRLELFVSGRVQGVFYRQSTVRRAQQLRLTGWARNLPDGRVQVVAEGPKPDLLALLAFCRQGPRMAVVTDVDDRWTDAQGTFESFRIKR